MGPQLYRCGNPEWNLTPSATAGFNGATTLSLWKFSDNSPQTNPLVKLQWGHNFIVVEIFR